MNYSLDEAALIISEKINKPITARQIRELAIKGATTLSFIYRGMATNCTTETEENIYGWPYVLPGHITEIEMKGSYPANMFVYNDTFYKILSPNYAVTLTIENLLIDEAHISDLINNLTAAKVTIGERQSASLVGESVGDTVYRKVVRQKVGTILGGC